MIFKFLFTFLRNHVVIIYFLKTGIFGFLIKQHFSSKDSYLRYECPELSASFSHGANTSRRYHLTPRDVQRCQLNH